MKRRITVPGEGRVLVEPDVATVRLGVNVIRKSAGAARESAAATMNAILDAVTGMGIARRDVQTALVNLSPTMDYSNETGPRITGYQLLNSVTVTLRDLEKAGALIDAALAAGASTLDSLEFRLDDPTAAAEQARIAAMGDARARAQTLATAADAQLGAVLMVDESQPMGGPIPLAARAMSFKSEAASTPVESGSQEVSVSLTVTFELA